MRYASLSIGSLQPSVICLGGASLGSEIPADQSWRLLDTFADQGGNFVDTAHIYAAWLPGGLGASERTIGDWLRARGMRERFVVATKGGHPHLRTMTRPRLAPEELADDLRDSLDRLGYDYIDLYWLHRDDPKVPVGEILDALNAHLTAGRIRAIGASNWTVSRLQEAADYAQTHSLFGFCASQVGWSLAQAHTDPREAKLGMLYMDDSTLRFHQDSRFPVVAYSSQAQGFFSGRYVPGAPDMQSPKGRVLARRYFGPSNFFRLERARMLAQCYGCSPNQVALAYLLSQTFPVCAIAGCRTVEQVLDSCQAATIVLTAEQIALLRDCSVDGPAS